MGNDQARSGDRLILSLNSIYDPVPTLQLCRTESTLFPPRRRLAWTVALLALVGITLPISIQVRSNWINFHKLAPLVVYDLSAFQLRTGLLMVKYATAVPAGAVPYANPVYTGPPEPENMILMDWAIRHPHLVALTALLHTFALFDQDLVFVYNKTLVPWYRPWTSLLNHLAIGFAAVGVILWFRAARQSEFARQALAIAVVYVSGHLATHAMTAVEARFGIPLLLVVVPLALVGARYVFSPAGRPQRLRVIACIGLYPGCALGLSNWIRAQAPEIVAAKSAIAQSWQP